VAFAGATLLAVAAGLLMGRHPWLHALFEPLLELLRPLPKPALPPRSSSSWAWARTR
jgi:ABC-type nitrate/sulfonate/bicarbonate transport system permease component